MKHTVNTILEKQDLSGKVYLVTGAYAGLGDATTRALLKAGANVIIAGRNPKAQAAFAEALKQDPERTFEDHQLDASHTIDLGDLNAVRDFAQYVNGAYERIDCLINNAGVMYTPPGKTKDGFETQFGINVIGHYLLSKMLADKTMRQVWLSSRAHTRLGAPRIDFDAIKRVDENRYQTQFRYQQSKLGNILLAKQFAAEYPHLQAVSVHPGVVKTSLGRNFTLLQKLKLILKHPLAIMNMKSPEEGAATQVLVATLPEEKLVNGAYYADCKVTPEA
ncbi:MAG: SDR family NAD(P)-dependent oxidoreductase, partial [Bacteroidota bacterium]